MQMINSTELELSISLAKKVPRNLKTQNLLTFIETFTSELVQAKITSSPVDPYKNISAISYPKANWECYLVKWCLRLLIEV